jgi:hypothetical protein
MTEFTNEEHFCTHCQEYTPHDGNYSDHERDSSMDLFICRVCEWEYDGMSGKYREPWENQ